MTAPARTRKTSPPQLDLLEAAPDKSVLPIEVRGIGRGGVLELMRIGAGLSYKEVGKRAGMVPIKAMRLIRGEMLRPRRRDLEGIREVLWEALPAIPDETPLRVIEEQQFGFLRRPAGKPKYLTLKEAADLLKVNADKMRRLVCNLPELGAIKVGIGIRIPVQAIENHILTPRRAPASQSFMSQQQAAALFRVHVDAIRYAIETGRIRCHQAGKHYPRRIPVSEIERIAQFGTTELRPHKNWHRPDRRKKQ
jgi:excisionase family DNA binding protein